MFQNKVVARYVNGRVVKGFTSDFTPMKDHFHIMPENAAPVEVPIYVSLRDLKAVFFVKDFKGNPQYNDKKAFDGTKPAMGRKIQVVFKDGELLLGTTQGYQAGRPAFFIVPADTNSNIDRCFVISGSTKEVKLV